MDEPIRAKTLTAIQLKMLDAGAPVIIPCPAPSGELVYVRLQTRHLAPIATTAPEEAAVAGAASDGEAAGCWASHGAYVAIMPSGVDYGC